MACKIYNLSKKQLIKDGVNAYYDILDWDSEPVGFERNDACDEMYLQGYIYCCGMCE